MTRTYPRSIISDDVLVAGVVVRSTLFSGYITGYGCDVGSVSQNSDIQRKVSKQQLRFAVLEAKGD